MPAALLAAVVLLAAPACWAVTLTRGPYLTLQTRDSITVVWNTDIAANCGLSIGPAGGGTTVLAGPALSTVCAVTAAGLTPGASYSYVPQANGVALRSASAFRADHPSAPFRFGVVGDTGTGSSGQMAVRDRMLAGGLDLLIHTGDMVYEHGELEDQDPMFFTPYKDLIRQLVFWPVMGNHDYEEAGVWSQVHFTPANNAARNDAYYSFDRGNAHFVVIDTDQSTSRGSPQYVFLDQDLAASTAPWKFVFFHHAFYVSSGSASNVRSNLAPLFDAYRVDVVFMGHVHVYERSRPLRAGAVVSPGAGTVYVTTGGGGAPLTGASSSSTTAYSESANHYARVSVDGGTLALEMIRRDGVVRDTMTLEKGSVGSTTTTTTIIPSTTTSTTLPPGTSAVDVRVAAGSDDAEEDTAGRVSLTSSDLELTVDSNAQTVGMRFAGVAIPPGATIRRAWVQFTTDEASSDATALTIVGENVDASATFTTATLNVSGRARTPETVAWSPPSWSTVGEAGAAQRTPDLTAIVQRIVNRPGWTSGNALSLIITGSGRRLAVAYEAANAAAALLHVEYGTAVTTTSTTSTTTTTLLPTTSSAPPTTSTTSTSTTTTSPPPSTTTTTTLPVATTTVETRVAAGSDDAEEAAAGQVSLSSSDLELTVDSNAQTVGMRFSGLAIPRGATIQRAWVQLTVDEATSDATALTITGENVDNSATFTTATRNVSNRGRTPETVAWSPSPWPTVGQAAAAQRTPDVTAIVQRIVNRPGWANGNALSLIVTGSGRRVAVAFEEANAAAALLHVEYGAAVATTSTTSTTSTTLLPTTTVAPTSTTTTTSLAPPTTTTTSTLPIATGTLEARVATSSDDAEEDTSGRVSLTSSDLELTVDSTAQTVGLRFRGLAIPRGAHIQSAWVQFKADKATSDATSLTIAGEAADNPATFTTASRNVSARVRTAATVAWTPAVWPTGQAAGPVQRTPELAAVVQQIVGRPGWASGNALVLLVTGTGRRVAVSFDEEAAGAPLLHVEYGPPPTTTTTSTSTTTTSTSTTTSTTEPSTTTTTTDPTTSTTEPPTTTTTTEPSTTSTTEPSTTTTTTEPTTSTTEPPTTTTTTEPSTTSTTEPSTTTTTTEPTTSTTEPPTTTTTTEPSTTSTTEPSTTTTTTEPTTSTTEPPTTTTTTEPSTTSTTEPSTTTTTTEPTTSTTEPATTTTTTEPSEPETTTTTEVPTTTTTTEPAP